MVFHFSHFTELTLPKRNRGDFDFDTINSLDEVNGQLAASIKCFLILSLIIYLSSTFTVLTFLHNYISYIPCLRMALAEVTRDCLDVPRAQRGRHQTVEGDFSSTQHEKCTFLTKKSIAPMSRPEPPQWKKSQVISARCHPQTKDV